MATNLSEKYSPFPSDFASLEEKKDVSYGLQYVKAIYATYIQNYPPTNPQLLRYITNRQFAEGTYDTDIYKNRLGLNGDASYLNLDLTSVNRIPTIVDNMVGVLTNKSWRIQCNPLDTVSRNKYDEKIAELKAERFLKKKSKEIEPLTGVPLVSEDKQVPEDDEELELYMQMNFKPADAMAMELALKWIFDNNNFDAESVPKIYYDLIVDKKTAIFRHYDENKNIRVKRWDHLKLIHPYSTHEDFHDVPYQALLQTYTIGAIAKMNPHFSDETLYEIAKNNAGQNNNAPWNDDWGLRYTDYYNAYGANAFRQFQNFNINVVNFYFLSPVHSTKAVIKSEKGRVKLSQKKDGYKSDKGVETITNRKLVRFEGYWVANTDYTWGYKMSENIERDILNGAYSPETELPCKIIMPNKIGLQNKSMVERMVPFEKQLCLAWYKLQQFLIESMPPGLAINQNALIDIVDGAGEGKPLPTDWTKLYKQTGNIVFVDKDAEGNPINIPFKELQGGISEAFKQFLYVMDYCINKMNEVVGYNAAVDGSTPKPDALVGVSQMAVQGTYNSMRPLYIAATNIINATAKRVALMVQDSLRLGNNNISDALIEAIGKQNVEILTMGRELPFPTAAISIELQPEEQEIAEIKQMLQLGIQAGTLNSSDVLRVNQQIKTNVKLAGQLLVYLEKKNAKIKQQQALELQQQNGQVQIQSAQAASQAQAEMDAILTENKIKIIQAEGERDLQLAQFKFEGDKVIQSMKNEAVLQAKAMDVEKGAIVQNQANQGKVAVESMKHSSNMQQIELMNSTKPEKTEK